MHNRDSAGHVGSATAARRTLPSPRGRQPFKLLRSLIICFCNDECRWLSSGNGRKIRSRTFLSRVRVHTPICSSLTERSRRSLHMMNVQQIVRHCTTHFQVLRGPGSTSFMLRVSAGVYLHVHGHGCLYNNVLKRIRRAAIDPKILEGPSLSTFKSDLATNSDASKTNLSTVAFGCCRLFIYFTTPQSWAFPPYSPFGNGSPPRDKET